MAFLITSVSMLLRIVSEFTTQSATSRTNGIIYIVFLCITASFNIVHWVMFVRMEQVCSPPAPPLAASLLLLLLLLLLFLSILLCRCCCRT